VQRIKIEFFDLKQYIPTVIMAESVINASTSTMNTGFIICKCGKTTTFKEAGNDGRPKFCNDCYTPKKREPPTISPMTAPDSKSFITYSKREGKSDKYNKNARGGINLERNAERDHRPQYHNDGSNDNRSFAKICSRHTYSEIIAWADAHRTLGTFLPEIKLLPGHNGDLRK
jgi:hypothetical protein